MEINETFKRIRKQRKLSLTKLSEVASSPAAISDFENGKTSLSVSTLVQLLGEMQVELTEFLLWKKISRHLTLIIFYELLKKPSINKISLNFPAKWPSLMLSISRRAN